MGPVFSPDGSRIVYTSSQWASVSISVAGGVPTLFMPNAAGLRWFAPGQVLYSETRAAPNMGVVAAREGGGEARDIYFPASPQGMAHFSERSPDGRSVLIVEMDTNTWLPCRVVPFDASTPGQPVGPADSGCTSAAWSPDGRWMYFTASRDGESHLWRQRFPDGSPEPLTSGVNPAGGVAVDPDGRSVITALGASQSVVWFHDGTRDRPISVEGFAYRPQVSPDGSRVFYLVRRAFRRSFSIGELWATELATGRNERVLPDVLIRAYDVSRDGQSVVFDAFDEADRSRIWIGPTNRSQAPRRLTLPGGVEEQRPIFAASGEIFFMQEQSGERRFIYRMKPDGTDRRRISGPITFLVNMAPTDDWAVVWGQDGAHLLPVDGGPPRSLCDCSIGPIIPDSPGVSWSGDGQTLVVSLGSNRGTVLLPWRGADTVPAGPLLSPADLRALPGARYVPESSVATGPMAGTFAYTRQSEQSNLYRIRVP
jgi:Tol biopolymer transport system component